MSRYSITVTREADAWVAAADDIAAAHTWARSLPALDRNIREAIALALDLPEGAEGGLELDVRYEVDDEEVRQAAALGDMRRALEEQERANAEAVPPLLARLFAAGYSVRDAAVLLGMSPGRVSQVSGAGLPQVQAPEDFDIDGPGVIMMSFGGPEDQRDESVYVVPSLDRVVRAGGSREATVRSAGRVIPDGVAGRSRRTVGRRRARGA